MTCHSDTPSEVRAKAAFGVLTIGNMKWGVNQGVNEIADAINRALDAAEARGYRRGMEEAAGLMCSACADGNRELVRRKWGALCHVESDGRTDCSAAAIRSRLSERGEGGDRG